MASVPITQGELDYDVPSAGKPCKTWYKIFGDIRSSVTPLVVLHGGPGASHEYLLVVADLATSHGIPVVLYDQIGNANSTHLPEKAGDATFWTDALFFGELDNLITKLDIQTYDLLGQSWGGMLAARHAIRRPRGLRRLVLADAIADVPTYLKMEDQMRLELPADVQEALTRGEREGKTAEKKYQEALEKFNAEFVCRVDPMPEDLAKSFAWYDTDSTVYSTMIGVSDLVCNGSLHNWTVQGELHQINVPTLVVSGRHHPAQDWVNYPFFNEIPRVRWIAFEKASHITPHEEREKFMQVVGDFLKV